MTSLKVIAPDADTAAQLQSDILPTIYKKLEEFDYAPTGAVAADAEATVHGLQPRGDVWIKADGNVVTIKVRHTDIDQKGLYIEVLADVEERIDGVSGEID